jgi:branched-chain amino acid transport system permease protein
MKERSATPRSEAFAKSLASHAPRIGVDEWVAQVEKRRRQQNVLVRGWLTLPLAVRYALALLVIILIPPLTAAEPVLRLFGITSNEFIIRIGAQFLVSALLAIGLNVVVGYAGLLDLGYMAFYGIAGYLYAYVSSDFVTAGGLHGIHLPTLLSLPLIMVITTLVGWGIGAVSIRLVGDYLAIVTLGFGQIFVQLLLSATRVQLPWRDQSVDLTRGPNGINGLDNLALGGFTFQSTLHYYYLFLILLVLVYLAVDHLNRSRLGRGWRAMREDELAAEVMGMPTRRLKLRAFAIGAAIAALAGVVDAAWQGNVSPNPRYSIVTLINLYGMVVLGGIGSLPGVVLGALIFTVLPEILRSVALSSLIFYGAGFMALCYWLRPYTRLFAVVGGTLIGGFVLKGLALLLWPGLPPTALEANSLINQWVQRWLVIPAAYTAVGNVVTISAVILLLTMLMVKTRWRWALLSVAIYLLIFAWETRLAVEPSATRILIIGVTLVVLMITRPQGLLGKPEVRVV